MSQFLTPLRLHAVLVPTFVPLGQIISIERDSVLYFERTLPAN
jgi:hypothetical protein